MENNQFVSALRDEERRLEHEISILENELEEIQRMIKRRSADQVAQLPLPIGPTVRQTEHSSKQVRGPVEAVRSLFDESPEKMWSPIEIKNRLEIMKNEGTLQSNTKRLFGAVHTALGSLVHSKYVIKHPKNRTTGVPTYSKAVSKQGSTSAPNAALQTKVE